MTARIRLDDTFQNFSQNELRFLVQLAALLPASAVVRAAHESTQPSPLTIALDIRLTSTFKLGSLPDDSAAKAEGYERLLRQHAQQALRDFAFEGTNRSFDELTEVSSEEIPPADFSAVLGPRTTIQTMARLGI